MKALVVAAAVAVVAFPVAAQNRTDKSAQPFPVTMTVDASQKVATLKPIWRFFGADEPNYATMKDGRALLTELGGLRPGQVYFRAHNLLTSGDGTPALKWGSTNAYTEDASGNPVYNWTIVDRIFDTYLARGIKPYVEIGFMPEALSSQPEPYQHTWRPGSGTLRTGWAYPPKDYAKWEELVYQWARHCVDRYGAAEVSTWYWQTWNEANLPQYYWGGTREEFFKLHDASIRAVRRALPQARVGGPDMAGARDDFMTAFMDHVETSATPTDFLSFHAKGNPQFLDGPDGGHVRMGIATQLQAADHEFTAIALRPAFKAKPIVIGEFDPEGCAACQAPANAYRNGTMYASYTAASFTRVVELAQKRGVNLEGVLSWAFTFEDQRYFAGFRQLASSGIDLPVLNVFRLFSQLGPDELASTSSAEKTLDDIVANGVRTTPDVGVIATRTPEGKVALLVWHYHDDDVSAAPAAIDLKVSGLGKARGLKVTQWRVDGENGNAFSRWQTLGSPVAPNEKQYAELKAASVMTPAVWTDPIAVKKGQAQLRFTVPRQGVTLLMLD